jgi:hypothetical protein
VAKRLAEPAETERPPTTLRFSGHLIVRGSSGPPSNTSADL